jgi:hypothetical protein
MWIVGNEWNYNKLYSGHSLDECVGKVEAVAAAVRARDPDHPVATVYGEVPDATILGRVKSPDLWGMNLYPGLSFGDRFDRWKARSTKPFFVSEYGADAWHKTATGGYEDQDAQAEALSKLGALIYARSSARDATQPCLGGTPFAWNDEWWKSGDPANHSTAGFDNGGVYPDGHATEEWWGVVDAFRKPRKAYAVLADLYK